MKQSIDLDIPDQPLNLDQLLVDCKDTMKYGVKTGKKINKFSIYNLTYLLRILSSYDYICITVLSFYLKLEFDITYTSSI